MAWYRNHLFSFGKEQNHLIFDQTNQKAIYKQKIVHKNLNKNRIKASQHKLTFIINEILNISKKNNNKQEHFQSYYITYALAELRRSMRL